MWEVSHCDIDYTGTGNTTIQGTIGIVSFGCTDLFFRDHDINATNQGAFYHGLMLSNTTAFEALVWPPTAPLTPNASGVSWFESAAGNSSGCQADSFVLQPL